VDGEPITLAQFELELARARTGLGTELASSPEEVLEWLIDRRLLAQAAQQLGLGPSEEALQAELQAIRQSLGGDESFQQWLSEQGYDLASFISGLREDLQAAAMVEEIIKAVPDHEEHVHALHILVATREEAEALRQQALQADLDFGQLALEASLDLSTRIAGGDLGWFARGTLTVPQVEAAAFSLSPGQVSQVIESEMGFHIIKVLAREDRPLSRQALLARQRAAVEEWLAQRRQEVQIERYLGP